MSAATQPNRASITVAILAGGASTRMGGVDKGLQTLNGRPLVDHVSAALRPQCANLVVCANRNLSEYERYATVLTDDVPGFKGPLAGIATALRRCKTEWLLTVSVDAPNPPVDLAKRLSQSFGDKDIAVADDGNRRQPLFALYRQTLAENARAALDRDLAVWRWQDDEHAVVVDFSDTPESFRNLNTLEDFSTW
jgi:molybdopterin-guanine dinucleotide biosynthesis protein A